MNSKHKGNHNRSSGFISDETHVDYHKTFALPRVLYPRILNTA